MTPFLAIARAVLAEASKDRILRESAVVAYYSIFSLPSFLLMVISIAGFFVGNDRVKTEVFERIDLFVVGDGAELLKSSVEGISSTDTNVVMTALGVILLFVTATVILRELRGTLDIILDRGRPPRRSVARTVIRTLVPFFLVLCAAASVIFSLALTASFSVFGGIIASWSAIELPLLLFSSRVLSFLLIAAIIFLLYRFLPSHRLALHPMLLGAVTATFLLFFGKGLLGLYLSISSAGAAYGVAASVLVLLLWTYYCALSFLLGAEVVDVLSRPLQHRKKKN